MFHLNAGLRLNKWCQHPAPRWPHQQDSWWCLALGASLEKKIPTIRKQFIQFIMHLKLNASLCVDMLVTLGTGIRKCISSLPVTESLTESLRGEVKSRLETLVWYWHWYNPSLSKFTWRMLKVAELELDVWVFLNDPDVCCRVNVPPKCWVEIEQVMPTSWPQVTSPTGFMEMLGFGRFTGKKTWILEL